MADTATDEQYTATVDVGSINDGVFTSDNDWKLTDETKPDNGEPNGWCDGYGRGISELAPRGRPDGHILYGALDGLALQCHSWKPAFHDRKRRYRYITRAPNSDNTGLFRRAADGSSTSTEDVIVKGKPCVGAASAKWKAVSDTDPSLIPDLNQSNFLECVYPKIDDTVLVAMTKAMADDGGADPTTSARFKVWHAAADYYCNKGSTPPDTKITVDNRTCKTVFENVELARKYCSTGDHIATQTVNCSVANLTAAVYDQIGNAFCAANPENAWCGCYNVINKTCTANPKGAGCDTLLANREIMKSAGLDVTVFDQKPQCAAPACNKTQGNVWKPASSPDTMTCDNNISICAQNIIQGIAKNAPINASCSQTTGGGAGAAPSNAQEFDAEAAAAQMDKLDKLDKLDAEDAAYAAEQEGEQDGEKKTNYTIIYIIVALLLLCCCAGGVFVMTR